MITPPLAGCERPARGTKVDPRDYDAFFLWAGVTAPAWLGRARTVYLLAGEVRARDPSRVVWLRAGVPHPATAETWLTIRVERLDWSEAVFAAVLRELARWDAASGRVVGLQIDFDAATRGLAGYVRFLGALRARLAQRWRLSVTGLLDWSAGADPAALAALAGIVDEIVIQTYQGTTTIPGYTRYLGALGRLPLPYRVALVEGGTWEPPPALARDPHFAGYVVFLAPD